MAGITSSVRTVAEIIPPTIGDAIRFITSAPVPELHRIGISAAVIAVTVITTGRSRSNAPSRTAGPTSAGVRILPVRRWRWNASSR